MSRRAPSEAGCPSQYQLDRLSADEVTDIERARLERHVVGCAACAGALEQRAIERSELVADPRLLARLAADGRSVPPPRRARRRWAWAPAFAVAIGLLIAVRASQTDPRPPARTDPQPPARSRRTVLKGGADARIFIERSGRLLAIEPAGESPVLVQSGDRLQVAIRLPEPRFVAVYSIDGSGTVSRYAPVDTPMVRMPAGEQVLPNSTILDDVLGRETVTVFACAADQSDLALRRQLRDTAVPECQVSRVELVKVPR
jgi:hypothetical protein